jgi:Cu2+-containing amine oxidase
MTEKQKAIRELNELLKLQEESGAFGSRAQEAIDIMTKKIDDLNAKESAAAQEKIADAKALNKERGEMAAKSLKDFNTNAIKMEKERKAAIRKGWKEEDKRILEKAQANVDAITGNKISEARVGFSRAISKGISSKGLADSSKRINEKQLTAQEKLLKVAEKTLVAINEKQVAVAG